MQNSLLLLLCQASRRLESDISSWENQLPTRLNAGLGQPCITSENYSTNMEEFEVCKGQGVKSKLNLHASRTIIHSISDVMTWESIIRFVKHYNMMPHSQMSLTVKKRRKKTHVNFVQGWLWAQGHSGEPSHSSDMHYCRRIIQMFFFFRRNGHCVLQGYISALAKTHFHFLNSFIASLKYTDILQEHMLPFNEHAFFNNSGKKHTLYTLKRHGRGRRKVQVPRYWRRSVP